jgi:hypothetical protein
VCPQFGHVPAGGNFPVRISSTGTPANLATRRSIFGLTKPVRRKPDGERRDALIKVLATPDDREAFQKAADAAGLSPSTWLRHVAIKAAKNA